MQSPPATMACTRVSSLRPGRAAPGRSPKSTSWSVACSIPSRSAKVAGSSSPAGDSVLVVDGDVDLVQHDMGG